MTIFRSMIITSLRDKISLFFATIFPLGLLFGLGYYFDSPSYQHLLVTGVISISVLFWSVQGAAFQVHGQRNKGVYKLLKMTPISTMHFIIIMTLARTTLGVIINLIVLGVGVILFNMNLTLEGALLCTAFIILGTIVFTILGFVISNFAKDEGQINTYANMIYLPMVFGSDAFYSLENVPSWIVSLGNALPFTHLIEVFRISLNIHDGPMMSHVIILLGYLIGLLLLASVTFRWETDHMSIGIRRFQPQKTKQSV